jgi:molybdopterin/thiamine biosynthesis adenylyltransferase
VAGQPAGALELDSQRIRHLTGDSPQRSRVTIIGLGSGGFPVMQHLAMSGWRRFTLIDHDTLEDVNLVKHPARRNDLGRLKVDIAAEWLADRNPASEVAALPGNFLELASHDVDKIMAESDLVVSATDSNEARNVINEFCVQTCTPMTLGLVHRGGTGGTVMAYRPGTSGCYTCLQDVADSLDGLPSDHDFPFTREESEQVYGRGVTSYGVAGLSADIALVAAILAQVTVRELLSIEEAAETVLPPMEMTWIAVQVRSATGWEWRPTMIDLPRIDNCPTCGLDPDGDETGQGQP